MIHQEQWHYYNFGNKDQFSRVYKFPRRKFKKNTYMLDENLISIVNKTHMETKIMG